MLIPIISSAVLALMILTGVLTLAALLTWAERKESALMQDRIGANRAAILGIRAAGLVHIAADALKMMFKEDFIPPSGNKIVHTLGPILAFFPVLVIFAVVPIGSYVVIGGHEIGLQVADLNIGLLLIFAFASLSTYGMILGGWSSNNKFSMLGAIRAGAQMISYEIALGLSIIGVIMVFGSLSLTEIVRGQGELLWGFLPKWGIFVQPLGFLIFLPAAVAESKRIPFDMPEGESEIIGYWVEYSSMKFGMYFFAEFIEVVIAAALVVTFFLGGYQVPYLYDNGFIFPWGWELPINHWIVVILQMMSFAAKMVFICWFLLLVRWTLPRFRYDQLMNLGWKGLLPLALVNIFITGLVILWIK